MVTCMLLPNVEPSDRFERDGSTIYYVRLELSSKQLLSYVRVPTVHGDVDLVIPEGNW